MILILIYGYYLFVPQKPIIAWRHPSWENNKTQPSGEGEVYIFWTIYEVF